MISCESFIWETFHEWDWIHNAGGAFEMAHHFFRDVRSVIKCEETWKASDAEKRFAHCVKSIRNGLNPNPLIDI